MRQFRIALLHYTCPPIVGGVEEIIRQHASLFKRHNHTVKVFAGDGTIFADEYDVQIYPLLSSRNPRVIQIQNRLPESSKDLESCTEEIFTLLAGALEPFEVLFAHNVLTMPYNLPLTLALHRLASDERIRVVSWNHDSPYFCDSPLLEMGADQWNILKEYNPDVFYVTISEERRREFEDLYGVTGLDVIPDGIDPVTFFNLSPGTARIIAEKDLLGCDLLMVQPCRLHPRKNIELSIEVVKALQEKGLYARLLLTGAHDPHEKKTTEYYRELRRLSKRLQIENDILIAAEYFCGSGEDLTGDTIVVRDFCLIADVLFMPSLQEGFGIPLLEAGMLKLPIICSDIPPFREIGQENVQYFSLKDSPDQIADKILAFVSDLKPHRMFRNMLQNYLWDDIYHHMLSPLLERIFP